MVCLPSAYLHGKNGLCFILDRPPFLGGFALQHSKYILHLNLQVESPAAVELTARGFYGCQNFIQVLKVKHINERKSAQEN